MVKRIGVYKVAQVTVLNHYALRRTCRTRGINTIGKGIGRDI